MHDLVKWISQAEPVLSAISAGIAIVLALWGVAKAAPKVVKNFTGRTKQATSHSPYTVAQRFVALFESHGVKRNQITGFFGHDLTIGKLATDEELTNHLTPEILKDAALLFGVNQDWLEGASETIYEVKDFYKHPEDFEHFLQLFLNRKDKFFCYVLNAQYETAKNNQYDGIILLEETIAEINGRPVYRYHFCGKWLMGYWKSRGYLAACCALLFKYGFHPIGKNVSQTWLVEVTNGTQLMQYDYESPGLALTHTATWYVDEFIEKPDRYLQGVDPEMDKFGFKAALSLWLELSQKGYMDCFNDGTHQKLIHAFKKKLLELNK